MARDDEVRAHLDLSRAYLATARAALAQDHAAPAHFNALHALELAIKACLVARLGEVPRTHNVGGLFGREFRAGAGDDLARRVNRALLRYDEPRYPDEPETTPDEVEDVVLLVEEFVDDVAPRLVEMERRRKA